MNTTERAEPVWLSISIANAVHDRQLAEHGGGGGVRDAGLLASALAHPINRWSYGEDDRCMLAASYAFDVARNHPFVDGNKPTAWVLARLFLRMNNIALSFMPAEAITMMLALSVGDSSEEETTNWFHDHLAAE